jgi:hypothetical protein
MEAGIYKGKGVLPDGGKDTTPKFGDANTGTLQLYVDLELRGKDGSFAGRATTFLTFTDKAAVFSIERLRALGWQGTKVEDLKSLAGIDKNEVEVEVRNEVYNGKTQMKVEIVTGRVAAPDKPVATDIALARIAAMLGQKGAAGGPEAPF